MISLRIRYWGSSAWVWNVIELKPGYIQAGYNDSVGDVGVGSSRLPVIARELIIGYKDWGDDRCFAVLL